MRTNDKVFWNSRTADKTGNKLRAAKVLHKNGNAYQILFLEKQLFGESYGPVLRWVSKSYLSPRILPLALLNEPMLITFEGFNLTFKLHKALSSNETGEKYSAVIDGYEIGTQTDSEEAAVALAYKCLTEGVYETALRSNLKIYLSWVAEGVNGNNLIIAENGIKDVTGRLNRLELSGLSRNKNKCEAKAV